MLPLLTFSHGTLLVAVESRPQRRNSPRNAKSTLYIIIERSLISMETMQNILTRRSVRKFADKPIEPDKLHTILEAAMSGPCAVNARERPRHRIGLARHLAGRKAREAAGGDFPAAGDDCTALDTRARLSSGGYRYACSAPQPLRRKPRTR